MDSDKSSVIGVGEVIDALELKVNDSGTTRIRFSGGWVSERTSKGDLCFESAGTPPAAAGPPAAVAPPAAALAAAPAPETAQAAIPLNKFKCVKKRCAALNAAASSCVCAH